jgi:hypothetical protein
MVQGMLFGFGLIGFGGEAAVGKVWKKRSVYGQRISWGGLISSVFLMLR